MSGIEGGFRVRQVTRKSKRAVVRGGHGTSQELTTISEPIVPILPWVLGPVLWSVGMFVHQVWLRTENERLVGSLGILAIGAVLGWVTWHYARARTDFQRWHATVTPLLFSVIAIVPLLGGWGRYVTLALIGYWIALAGAWSARVARSVWGDGADIHGGKDSGALAEMLGLTGATVSHVQHHGKPGKRPVRTTGRLTLPAPFGYAEIVKAREAIQNTARAAHVTVRRVGTDPRSGDITIVFQDMLKDARAYPGPSLPLGASITAPLTIGVRQDGSPERVWLVTEHGTVRMLVVGCAGSGKSRVLWDLLAESAGRCDVVWWIADIAKAGQTVNPARDMFDWIAPNMERTQALLDAVAEVGRARSEALGDDQSWHPGCGFPLLVVWIEEAAGATSKLTEQITRLSERVRSVGIALVLSMQRPSGKNMPTDARAQFTAVLCFGTDDQYTGKMALNPGTLEAGAAPELIADTVPGMHWHEGPNVPRLDWAEPCRSYLIDAPTLRQIVAETAPYRAKLDAMSARAAGDAYAHRWDEDTTPSPQDDAPTEVLEPTRVQTVEEILEEILDTLGEGQHTTKEFRDLWEPRTGKDRTTLRRYLEKSPRVINNGDGTWNVRPGT